VPLVELNYKSLATLLAGLCGLMLVVIVLQLQFPPRFEEVTDTAPGNPNLEDLTVQRQATEEFALAPLEDYEEIVTRPLFRPDRRPPEETLAEAEAKARAAAEEQQRVEEAQAAQTPIEELFVLNGVVVTEQKTIALLQDIENNRNLRVSEGENLEDRLVKQIAPNRVLFSSNGREETLELVRNFEEAEAEREQKRQAVQRSIQRRRSQQRARQ
jgi:general secretion pathway protein N